MRLHAERRFQEDLAAARKEVNALLTQRAATKR
jgi:hypothetical protein